MPVAADNEIWITGLGLVSAFGTGGREVGSILSAHNVSVRSAAAHGESLPVSSFDKHAILGQKGLRLLSAGTLYFMAASRLALTDAGLETTNRKGDSSRGIVAGTFTANANLVADFDRTTLREGPAAVNPSLFAQTVWNGTSSQCAIRFGFDGPNITASSGTNSGLDALIVAFRQLECGAAEIFLAGGYEELTPFFTGLFNGEAGTTTPSFFSEGAAVLVMEKAASAQERAAEPLAIVRGGRSGFMPGTVGESEAYHDFRNGLIADTCRDAGARAETIGRTWWAHAPQKSEARLNKPAGNCVDVVSAFGCSGGLSGALACVLAVTSSSIKRPSTDLVLAEDGLGRAAALLLELP